MKGKGKDMVKAIILDMYGVVLEQTGDDFVPHVQKDFPELSHDEIYIHWLRANVGEIDSLDIWRGIGYAGNLEQVEKTYLDTQNLNPGFPEFIRSVYGRYRLALLSNDVSRWSRYLRDKFDLDRYFDSVYVSGDLGFCKPDPRMFRMTMEKLGVQPGDCLYVDDRQGNLRAAAALGICPVMLNSRNESYDGITVNSFRELEELLQTL